PALSQAVSPAAEEQFYSAAQKLGYSVKDRSRPVWRTKQNHARAAIADAAFARTCSAFFAALQLVSPELSLKTAPRARFALLSPHD
ncbi:MAG: hypothetical protein AAFO75_00080, partial [Pseudomonadota bacterium]